ncbi:hypothetical protein HYH02_014881 [Chlamydomonas schloesseri]|uniref:Uncharacterized protein n=1 Tax=Chlamydomonas schloesseri TaxID=2026947 RepID=A0A835SPS1_9CHLO|nr:hypothetical protein HYH02_014881 [Chlamydomonas schloesseri]|eukprot:KAG2426019.1 hypothetical protein HYH02_014881 [Chlamydomonas schloesseri]
MTAESDATGAGAGGDWKRLTPDLMRRVAESACIDPNEIAIGLRLVDRETAAALEEFDVIKLGEQQSDPSEPVRAHQPWPGDAFVAHWGRPEPWRALTLPQRRRLLCLAASSGHAPSLEAALAHAGCALTGDVLTAAAAAGNLEGCERLLGEGAFREANAAVEAAAQFGHLPALQLLLKRSERGARAAYYAVAVRGACAGGQAHVLDWMRDTHGFKPKPRHALLAAESGQAEVLELLLPQVEGELAPEQGQGQAGAGAGAAANTGGHQLRRQESFRLLTAIALGCPLPVLQRHYDRLWAWSSPATAAGGGAAGAAGGGAAQQGQGLGLGLGLGQGVEAAAAAPEWALGPNPVGWAERQRDRLLVAAAASASPDWAAKVDWLRSRWGSEAAAAVAAAVTGEHELWHVLFGQRDALSRLRHLRAAGVPLTSPHLPAYAAAGGHADALAYLWDECGIRPAALSDDVMCGAAPRAAAAAAAAATTPTSSGAEGAAGGEASPSPSPVYVLLRQRGAGAEFFNAQRAEREALAGASDASLLFLAEVAAAADDTAAGGAGGGGGGSGGGGGGGAEAAAARAAWSAAFRNAAQYGAGLAVLRALHGLGAAIDLEAVACGGSVAALEWAAAELEAEGRLQPPVLNVGQQQRVARSGNTATVEWLRTRGMLPAATQR